MKNNLNLKEMPFEKGIASTFLGALGWNPMLGNLKEQYVMGHTNWKADFALFVPGKKNPEIIVELKKPLNKQTKKNREQVSDYLKLKDCRFGIYFGEKLELFFLANINEDEREMKSVLTVDYDKNSPFYKDLLSMLRSNTYSRERMITFCNEQLAIREACQYWQTQDGAAELINLMMEHSKLDKELAERFHESIEVLVKAKNNSKNDHSSMFSISENGNNTKRQGVTDTTAGMKLSLPRFQFWMAGMKGGETIEFSPTGVKVKVVMPNKVEYNGQRFSLSGFCKMFMPPAQTHKAGTYEGPAFFTFNGESLKDIRTRMDKERKRKDD